MLLTALQYISIIALTLLLIMLANKMRIAYPIMLIVCGLLVSFVPFFPSISIDPELIFVIFLPPLLYEAAWYTSWKELWRWRRVIGSFAFLIVLVTSLVVALVASSIIPGFTLALGFLLGGIVSPPDAVSAAAILKYVKVPRRMASIIEGESLLNDASSLIVFRFALIAVSTGRFVFHEAVLSFFWVIIAGIAIGIAIGYLFFYIHKLLPTDDNTDIALTIITPYVMYITAEMIHVSGVLAVVSGGLLLSARSHLFLSHSSRLKGASVWSAIGFILNGLVFILIGLELPIIIKGFDGISLRAAIGYGVLITAILMVARILCAVGASFFTVFISRYITTADPRPGLKAPLIFGWAGMRGVVSLAAALSIPIAINNGTPFPQRNLILFITFIVILLTLVVQGLSLPKLIRLLKMEDPDHFLSEEEQEAEVARRLAEKSRRFLQHEYSEEINANPVLHFLEAKWKQGEDMNQDHQLQDDFKNASLKLIEKQRDWLHKWNEDIVIDDAVIRKYLMLLDMEEEQLMLKYR